LARFLLLLEYLALFVGLPLVYSRGWFPLPLFPALWLLAGACLAALLSAPGFDRSLLLGARGLRRALPRVLPPFLLAAPLLLGATALFDPRRLLVFPRERPLLWAVVMVLYPILSVLPQGVVYRSFVFHRYRSLFPGPAARIVASATAFGFVHVVFHNWIAPVLGFAGGLLFAWTYERSRSGLAASLQHALFGCWLFTIGLGWYFYHGAVR
jgi:membrane protease YdiL (CAAX protease family)